MSKLCKRILLILAVFSSFLTLFACSAIQIDTYHVELPQDKYQLRVGQEIEALPIVSKNGQECDLEVSYHSYDASIATYVDGKIVALKSGEVRIKVTLKNNSKVYATALVTVVNDDSLIVDFNYEKTMIKGTTQLLTYELLVEKNRKLTFTSSNENVATIDELGNIKAITVGTTTIETVVSSLYDEGVSKTYKLVIEVKDLAFAINYVLDGGTNSENNPNEYVPEKLPLLLENPTKSGYKFVGWYDNENFTGEAITEISAGTMGDVTLYAKWNALDYRISYELNGGTNAENPDGYDVSDLPVSLHAPSRTGYIFKGWYMGENRVLAIPVGTTGNVVVSAKWEPITYTIDFDTNGGLPTLSSIDYTIESDSFTLQEITKAGYTFDGWYNGETKVTEITTGTYGNMTLVAKWTADLYTISYDLADGVNSPENPTSYTIESGLITLKDPTREGYTFAGWYNGEQLITTIDSNALENISLTAKWTVNSYKLTFDVDGILTEKTFEYGQSVRAIENPTKVGHTFTGWSKELPVKMPANDLYVSATWRVNSYTITFNVDGNLTEKTFKYGETVVAIENPTKEGHTFAGWSEELPETMPANDITVEAIWTVNSYKITFDVEGIITEKTFKYGESVVAIENPTKEGHTFAGWSEELPVKMPANDITVEAIWTVNSYKLTFDVDGNLTEKTFKYGESVTAIENPTKVGHTFAGWSKELPVKMPANDITVEATWTVNSYKLTFDVDGNLTEKTFKYGESVVAIENPTKEGHTFAGWSKEIPATMPAEDLTVKATWTINSYKLTLDVDGNLNELTYEYGKAITGVENPTKAGYTFAGWSPVLPETMPAEDLTVKATWTINSYDITYDFAGGEFKNVDYLNTPLHKFAITDYLTYQAVTGAEVALMENTPAKFWVYILLKNTNNDGLYEIVQIADGSANVTAEYDYVIAWHSGLTDASAKSILQKMLASSLSYIGGYVKLSNVPSNKTADCNITAEVYKASDIVINDPLKTSYTIEDSVELPTPSRTGYVFDGWYVNGTKLENIALGSTGNLVLKAQWKVMVYNVSLNPDGGKAKYATWDEFVADFLKDFCTYVWNNPTKITSAADFFDKSFAENATVQAKIVSFFTDNAEKWGFLSDELDAGIKKANWASYDKTNWYYYRCNLAEYLTKTKRTAWPASCGAFDGMLDPAWISPICDPKYATWDEFVADFLKDFCTYVWNNPTKITNAAEFFDKSYAENATVQARIVSFFTDNAEKWGFLSDELDAGIKKANWASYDKTNWYYYRCNLAEYLTKTKRTAWPASCGAFDGMSDPAWVGYYELNYTVDDNIMLPQLYKESYTFLGWFNGDTKVDMIKAGTTGNLNLVAKWEKIEVYHDLNLDLDGGTLDEVPTQYLEGEEFILPIPTKEGYTFLGWFNGSEKVEKISAAETSDISLVAKWEKIKVYHDLNLDLDGGTLDEVPTQYLEGEELILPIPTKEGYTFLGWYNGSEKVEKISATETADISLVAKWKITTDHEGTEDDPYSVDDALKVAGTLTKGNSTTDKYYIKGIVSEITELSTSYGNATFKITVDGKTILVFRAKNEGNQNFTSTDDLYVGDEVVIYGNITNYNGTLEITKCYVVSNNKVDRPNPTEEPDVVEKTLQEIVDMDDETNKKASYKITVIVLGWGKNLTSYDAVASAHGDMIVSDLEGLNKIVVFGATATISALVWDSTNGKYTYTNKQDFLTNAVTKSINIGDTLELIVIRDSYNGNTQLNAIVTKVTPKPAVTSNLIFDLDGGTCADLPTSYEEGTEVTLPTPTKEGYDFLGWEYNGTIITSITATMTGDLILTAKWKESGTTLYFEKVTSVNDITDDGLYLIVYENGEKAYAFDSSLATLDAANNYKELALSTLGIAVDDTSNSVTFRITKNSDGTFAILSASGNYIYYSGSKNGLKQTSTKNTAINNITIDTDGYILITSSSSTLKFNKTSDQMRFRYYSSGQSSISLYKYSTTTSDPSKTHNINYNLPEGATNSNPTSYTDGDTITLVDPVLSGYTFEGWYDNAECTGAKITEISGYTTDITLYAKFSVDSGTKTTKWKLVTDASELSAGDEIVIASNSKGYIAGSFSSKYLNAIQATFNDDKTEITSTIKTTSILTLGGKVDAWTLTNSDGKLLGTKEAKAMALGSGTTTWKITVASNNATIGSTNSSYGRILHNVSSTRFLNYTSSTNASMLLPQIYKKVVE